MAILFDAITFVIACLAVGIGLFVVAEEMRQLHGRHIVAAAAKDVAAVAGGLLIAAAAGAYWLSLAVR